jgi:GNAT superfamily N-acetyltransferase
MHLECIVPQKRQEGDAAYNVPLSGEVVELSVALSAWQDERCIAAAGVYSAWTGRGIAWALLSDEAGEHMAAIVRRMRMVLRQYPARRIEMTVAAGFPEAHKLAKLLGFHCETPNGMTYFFPDGTGAFLYAMVK